MSPKSERVGLEVREIWHMRSRSTNSRGKCGEHVEKTTNPIRALLLEIWAKPVRDTSVHENANSSTTTAPIRVKRIPFESAHRVLWTPKKARGMAKIRGRYGMDSEKGTTVGEKKRLPSDDR
ncbi:hypothetical protein EDD15DRAFT_2190623 [Pisolithus albus]|nr:hypothetical protein EDD15DRAFT_2190623 [Pisolithus albus]